MAQERVVNSISDIFEETEVVGTLIPEVIVSYIIFSTNNDLLSFFKKKFTRFFLFQLGN